MKLSLVYSTTDCKLVPISYSQAYRDQWLALGQRFDEVQSITEDCSAEDIDGDVIVFYDPHSTHHIVIDGIENHKAVKYEYMDDPYQLGLTGQHQITGEQVVKLCAADRIHRAEKRGIDFIICPYTESYYEHFGPLLKGMAEKMLVWYPVSSDIERYSHKIPLDQRKHSVLANGSVVHPPGFGGYEFRKWAHTQPEVTSIEHCMKNKDVPRGLDYPNLLYQYAGSLALCDTHTPPKYLEIPLAGCVCFAQYQKDYERMGFKDGESCFYIDKENFSDRIRAFKAYVDEFQCIADAGRKIAENWTSDKFADHIFNHAKEQLNGN